MTEALTVGSAARLVGEIIMARRGSKHFHLERTIQRAAGLLDNKDLSTAILNQHWAHAEMLAINGLTDWANSRPGVAG